MQFLKKQKKQKKNTTNNKQTYAVVIVTAVKQFIPFEMLEKLDSV